MTYAFTHEGNFSSSVLPPPKFKSKLLGSNPNHMCLTANPGWEWQYTGFFCSFAMLICVQYKNNRVGNLPWRGFWKKNQFFAHRKGGGNADSCELYWLIFWFHIVILCKISFHLIGRTLYFGKELRFSFFESPLQKSNGGSKYENLISF